MQSFHVTLLNLTGARLQPEETVWRVAGDASTSAGLGRTAKQLTICPGMQPPARRGENCLPTISQEPNRRSSHGEFH